MLTFDVAHAVGVERDADGRLHAVTVLNRGEYGVLVWAGKLHADAEAKAASDIVSGDYCVRTTISSMSWHDVALFFHGDVFEPLVEQVIASSKRNERPESGSAGITI